MKLRHLMLAIAAALALVAFKPGQAEALVGNQVMPDQSSYYQPAHYRPRYRYRTYRYGRRYYRPYRYYYGGPYYGGPYYYPRRYYRRPGFSLYFSF